MRIPEARASICPIFVGRHSLVTFLYDLVDRARDGDGQVVVLSGEAGIGKSRLVQEARSHFVSREQGLTITGRCFEPDRALPYAPLL